MGTTADYILGEDNTKRGPGRRPLILIIGALILILIIATTVVVGTGDDPVAAGSQQHANATGPVISWVDAGSQPVPYSPLHGPARTRGGVAAGFSHDELGAVLAAVNISARLSALAGPAVYETTARQQCFGDIDATIEAIRTQSSNATPQSTAPVEVFYRVTGGQPSGDLVSLSIALRTPQSETLGGYAELDRTLRWIDGDWRMQVPPTTPRLVTAVDGYTSLGPIHG